MSNAPAYRHPPLGLFPSQPTPRLYDRAVEVLQTRRYSHPTQQAYIHWIRRLILHTGAYPRHLAEGDVNRFLTHLAVRENVAASTQNQALAALRFLCEYELEQPLNRIEEVVRARKPARLPAVLAREEVEAVLNDLDGLPRLICTLLYSWGLRLLEGLQLRVKDLDVGRGEITIRDGKGQEDRTAMLPDVLRRPLQDDLRGVREQHGADLKLGLGRAPLPHALTRKYPSADRDWTWQSVFPASSHYVDRGTGIRHRHQLQESVIQKAIRQATHRAGLAKRVTIRTFCYSSATHLLEDGYDIRTVQELVGHKDVQTRMIYTHVLDHGGGVQPPQPVPEPVSGETLGIMWTRRSP